MPEDTKTEKENTQTRRQEGAKIGTVRVDIAHQEKKTFEAVYKTEEKSFQLLIDEPEVRGGKRFGADASRLFRDGGSIVPHDAIRQCAQGKADAGRKHQDVGASPQRPRGAGFQRYDL
jgi:hypothetical protein